jgi:DNA mismatch repair protein MutL
MIQQNELEHLKQLLSIPQQISIVTHTNPDGDAIGSSLGLYHYLIQKKHKVKVIVPNAFPHFLAWMNDSEMVIDYERQKEDADDFVQTSDILFMLDFNNLQRIDNLADAVEKSDAFKSRPTQDAWKKLYEGLENNISAFEQQSSHQTMKIFDSVDEPKTIQSKANEWNYDHVNTSNFQVIQVLQKYLAIHITDGLLLIDQKKAYQRILYDQFIDHLNRKNGASQQLLFPITIQINPTDQVLFEEIKQEIKDLGFRMEMDSDRNFLVKGIPSGVLEEDCQLLIEGILEQIKNENTDFASHRNEKIAQSMANKTASKYTQKKRSNDEMNAMIGQLFASSNPNFSPNGEEISKLLTEDYFNNLFS